LEQRLHLAHVARDELAIRFARSVRIGRTSSNPRHQRFDRRAQQHDLVETIVEITLVRLTPRNDQTTFTRPTQQPFDRRTAPDPIARCVGCISPLAPLVGVGVDSSVAAPTDDGQDRRHSRCGHSGHEDSNHDAIRGHRTHGGSTSPRAMASVARRTLCSRDLATRE